MEAIKRLGHEIELQCESHGAPIKITACEVVNDGERFIFTGIPKRGTQIDKIFKRAEDINVYLQLALFQPFFDDKILKFVISTQSAGDYNFFNILKSPEFQNNRMNVCIPLGRDMRRNVKCFDYASPSSPHTLIGSGSGGGKSELTRCAITGLIYKYSVCRLNLVIIDTGGNSLDVFHASKHLSHPIAKDIKTTIYLLRKIVVEMERRIALPRQELKNEPVLALFWDEFNTTIKKADNKEDRMALKNLIEDILRRSRKTKIHCCLISSECKNDGIGISKSSLTSRIGLRTSDRYESRAVIECSGCELLPGKGAMLFKSSDQLTPLYVQGSRIFDPDIERIIAHRNYENQDTGKKFIIDEFGSSVPSGSPSSNELTSPTDEKTIISGNQKELADIILWVLQFNTISASRIKEKFRLGNRVDEIMDNLFEMKIISEKFANQPRKILIKTIEDIHESVMEMLSVNGYTEDDVATAIAGRKDQ